MGTSGEDGDLKTWKDGKPLNVMEHEQKLRKDKDFFTNHSISPTWINSSSVLLAIARLMQK